MGKKDTKPRVAQFWQYEVIDVDGQVWPIATIYARNDAEAYEAWEEYAVDGPNNVAISLVKEEKEKPLVKWH